MSDLRVHDVIALLDRWYPPGHADSWDAVGTSVGDPDAPLRRILLAVDPVRAVVDEAIAFEADLVVTHHPLLLKGVHSVAATTPKGRVVTDLVRHGITLHTCHTNADSPALGVSDSLARALGLTDLRPLDADPVEPLDAWVVYVPREAAAAVASAMHDAGAGSVGDYDRCQFVSDGTGSFRPGEGAAPAIGEVGAVEHVAETRVEMVAARRLREAVLAAALAAHPYEEVAYTVTEIAEVPDPDRGSGRVGTLADPVPLGRFATQVLEALPAHHSAVRVAGDPDAPVRTVAVCGGSGDFLLDRARSLGADAYVTSDLRHHPVSELREHADAPAVLDVPHWAAEWTWLPVLAERLRGWLDERGSTVQVQVSTAVTDPWTSHLGWSE
ncbi:Nif3-like dinuclear metal center hexameric protein [Mumia sp. zg.B53]|uniref:Nif3-like dinuclear metal center hexameric protein n=1 Tax=Mumia sp. zg.B53 TaxID=2855449 RepID=UPI001C6E10B1|nr:Nif3-like dinuclear metal center hexameric protein [Mumia sp. zg.B53]MBW9215913.1 Nif3-like dinuclear metal center hexameric protein [Mumia sp. zg.B53]